MAKRKTTKTMSAPAGASVSTRRVGGQSVVVVREKAAQVARKVKGARRSGAAGTSLQGDIRKAAMGGAGVGFIEKTFGDKIPKVPYVGRKGAIALAVYMFKPKMPLLRDVGIAAAAMAGYQLAREGKIDGTDDDWDDD